MISSAQTQQRAAYALQMLAVDNPGSQTVIVNAGAISPLVHLLSTTFDEGVKKKVSDSLETLVASKGSNEAAVSDLVVLLGTGSRTIIEHTVNDNYWGDGGVLLEKS